MRTSRWFLLMLPGLLGMAACSPSRSSRPDASRSLEDYYPLSVDNCWTYATSFQGQPQPDLKVCIVKEKDGYYLDNRPTPSRLRFDPEGLRDGSVRYLLKGPLERGHKWMSVADVRTVERFEILSVDKKVQVPAGSFADCVEVRMEVRMDDDQSMSNLMTFAPGVGIVDVKVDFKKGARVLPQSRMALKLFELRPKPDHHHD